MEAKQFRPCPRGFRALQHRNFQLFIGDNSYRLSHVDAVARQLWLVYNWRFGGRCWVFGFANQVRFFSRVDWRYVGDRYQPPSRVMWTQTASMI